MSRRPVISHKMVGSVVTVSSSTPGAGKQNNRLPTSGGGYRFTVELLSVYLRTRGDHILRNFRSGEGTVASPSPGCRAPL